MALEREIETYNRKLPELLADEGRYVVIHDEEIAGIRDDLAAALDLGYDRFGKEAFLARQISKTEKVLLTNRSLSPCRLSEGTRM